MVNLTLNQIGTKEEDVKNLLDDPAQKYLKNVTIQTYINKAFNFVDYQISTDANNQAVVKDAIEATAAWYCFGAYGNSISQTLQLQDIEAFAENLRHYKEVARAAMALIGIDLLKEDPEAIKNPLGDALPIIGYGGSNLDTN